MELKETTMPINFNDMNVSKHFSKQELAMLRMAQQAGQDKRVAKQGIADTQFIKQQNLQNAGALATQGLSNQGALARQTASDVAALNRHNTLSANQQYVTDARTELAGQAEQGLNNRWGMPSGNAILASEPTTPTPNWEQAVGSKGQGLNWVNTTSSEQPVTVDTDPETEAFMAARAGESKILNSETESTPTLGYGETLRAQALERGKRRTKKQKRTDAPILNFL